MGKPGDPMDRTAQSPITDETSDAGAAVGQTLPAAPPAQSLSPGTAVGRYVIEGPLGEGGMGVVYVAHDPQLGRQVALKLLRAEASQREDGSSDGRNRLVREAHAMAKLNHPNVVTIYDAGIFGEQVFLAVEVVEGRDVGSWLATPRPWREVLEVFLKAGRGLAAAHAEGLVHRDFKPANVLLGEGGTVKVTDFGLARASGSAEPETATASSRPKRTISATLLVPLTETGLVSGTPGYMPLEQLLGQASDARSDEFSFCVALYWGLYGELPFEGRLTAQGPNPIRAPPKGTRVPGWVRRALLRGLSIKPEDRYPTLGLLLEALAADPAVKRRRVLTWAGMAAAVLAAVGATAGIVWRQRAAADPCHDPEGKLTGVWDAATRARVRAAFVATGAPDAANTAAFTERAMDRVSSTWLAAYRAACEATRERHTQSETALSLRLDCLDDQLLDLRVTGELMSHPDAKGLSAGVGAAGKLPLPPECADARALSLVDQPAPERRPQVEALRLRLAEGRALQGAARYADAITVLEPLPKEAEALEDRSLEAKAFEALARACRGRSEFKRATELEANAESLAVAAHMDSLATSSAAALAFDTAVLGRPRAEVDAALQRAREHLLSAGAGGAAEFQVERAEGVVATLRGQNVEAAAHGRRALDLAARVFGTDSEETVGTANNLAASLEPLGQYDERTTLFRRAIATSDRILGPKNQRALPPLVNLSGSFFDLGRLTDADQTVDQIFDRMGPEDRIEAALGLTLRGALQASRGQKEQSLETLRQASLMAGRLHILESQNFVDLHRYAAEAFLRDGLPKLAVERYEKYMVHLDLPDDSPGWVAFLRLGGWAYLDDGQPQKALPILERALQLSAAHPFYPGWGARLRWQLAEALVATHGDRKRAEALAQAAQAELQGVAVAKALLAEVDAWRAKAPIRH